MSDLPTSAYCAHLSVVYRCEESSPGSVTGEWWECSLCEARFAPILLASLTPEGDVMEAAVKVATDVWLNDDGKSVDDSARKMLEAASPVLLAAKEREIEQTRKLYADAVANTETAWARVATLEGALAEVVLLGLLFCEDVDHPEGFDSNKQERLRSRLLAAHAALEAP